MLYSVAASCVESAMKSACFTVKWISMLCALTSACVIVPISRVRKERELSEDEVRASTSVPIKTDTISYCHPCVRIKTMTHIKLPQPK